MCPATANPGMSDDGITVNALADPDARPPDNEFWRTAEILRPPLRLPT